MKKAKNNLQRIHIDCRMLYSSGIGRCLREIIKELILIDSNITIYFYGSPPDYKRFMDEYYISQDRLILNINDSPIYTLKEQLAFSWINLKNKNIDIFYYPHYNLPFYTQRNNIFTIHDFIQFKFPDYFGKTRVKVAKMILDNSVKHAKKIIAVSESTAKDFGDYFPQYKEKVEVIFNGISKNFKVLDDKQKKDFAGRHKLGEYLLFIGNDKPHKNINGLINAFIEVKKEYAYLKLVIISRGFNLNSLILDDNIRKDIIQIDDVSETELINYYNCANMLALPSYYEGFGLPIVEAMACGCPVISSNISSMPEIAGGAAYLIDPFDVFSIKEGIKKLIEGRNLRSELIKKGIERAKVFDWRKTAIRYLETFREVYKKSINL